MMERIRPLLGRSHRRDHPSSNNKQQNRLATLRGIERNPKGTRSAGFYVDSRGETSGSADRHNQFVGTHSKSPKLEPRELYLYLSLRNDDVDRSVANG